MNSYLEPRSWMRTTLLAAGVYNIIWGAFTVLAPATSLRWLGLNPEPPVAQLWQCIGMIVGVYGVGYVVASRDPYRHWPITLVGLLGKVFGPIGFAFSFAAGTLPVTVGWTLITNDLIWWFPFAAILWGTVRYHQSVDTAYDTSEADDPLSELRTNQGEILDQTGQPPAATRVFLRHAGCTFCRKPRRHPAPAFAYQTSGCGIVLVHMGDDDSAADFFDQYGMGDVPRIADPDCRLYRLFGLDLGSFCELFGLRVWLRGFVAGVLNRHGVGRLRGNGFQMPGAYVYHCGQILGGFQHAQASDRPNYAGLAERFGESRIAVAR